MIEFRFSGDLKDTTDFLKKCKESSMDAALEKYGKKGVEALSKSTPKKTGKTAASWSYEIVKEPGSISIVWNNSNIVDDWCNIAVILQYGHATGNGGWVEGRDYINPAMRPIFDEIASSAWKEVIGRK